MSIATSRIISPSLSYSSGTTPSTRLASLDIFRGATIAMMLLVNNPGPGTQYPPLEHAPWGEGWTPTDLVFPFFLFIMGVAIPFSMGKRSTTESKGYQFLHILARGLSLFLLGEFIYSQPFVVPHDSMPFVLNAVRCFAVAFLFISYGLLLYPWKSKTKSLLIPLTVGVVYLGTLLLTHWLNVRYGAFKDKDSNFGLGLLHPDTLRIPGILQRIGVCYVLAASLALIGSWHLLLLAAIALIAGNAWLMLKVPYPSLLHPGQMVHGLLDKHDNFARYIDTRVLGTHAYTYDGKDALGRYVYADYPDPEGIVSTMTATATSLFGILVGLWLRSARPAIDRCGGLLSFGVIMACIGGGLATMLMPINKSIYTPSYCVLCAGLAMLGLGMTFYFADVLQYRGWGLPLKIYGMNAIAAFVFSGIAGRLMRFFTIQEPGHEHRTSVLSFLGTQAATLGKKVPFGVPSSNASLAFALGYVIFWFFVLAIMYACKLFLKV